MKTIKQLMSSPVVMATVEATVQSLRTLMSQHNISAIPITAEGPNPEIVGLVTDADLRNVKDATLPVVAVMSTKLFYINDEESTTAAANQMLKNGIQHLLVNDQDKVVGILSSVDLLKLLATKPISFQPHLYFV